jgi:hypothetical protein
MIISKGFSITKTSTVDAASTEHNLFSHPYTYPWQGDGDSLDGRNVSRDNLFSEPGASTDAGAPSGRGEPQRPPRNPFGAN